MGLQDPYGSGSVSDYNEPSGSGAGLGRDTGSYGSYGPQPSNQSYSTIQPLTPNLQDQAYNTVGPGGTSLSQSAMDYYNQQMSQNMPTLGETASSVLTGPGGIVQSVGDFISSSRLSTQETIQHLVDNGMDPDQAKDLVDYSQSQAGPGFEGSQGPGDHDGTTGNLLDPENVAGGGGTAGDPMSYGSMEDYIRAIAPEAMDLLRGGTGSAVDREQAALTESLGLLSPYAGTEAWDEMAALTGAQGSEAQQAAIRGIPQTEAQLAAQDRERRQQMRQAGAMGRAGGGATIQEMIDLGGRQQAETVARRLQALQPVSDINRQTASVMSGLEEGSMTRMSQLEQQLGSQLAGVLQGMVGPITDTRTTATELSGLQDVNRANQNSQLLAQLANIIGSSGGNNSAN